MPSQSPQDSTPLPVEPRAGGCGPYARTICCSESLAETHEYAVSRRAYYPSWQWRFLPVLIDFFHDETRSKLVSALMASLLYCAVTLQLFLPLLTQDIVTAVPTCFFADLALDDSTRNSKSSSGEVSDSAQDREKAATYVAASYLFWVFFFTTLAAVSRYHHPSWLLPACISGVSYVVLLSLGNTVYCFRLASQGSVHVFGHAAKSIAFFNILQWVLTVVVNLRLLMLVPRTLWSWRESVRSESPWLCNRREMGWKALGLHVSTISRPNITPGWSLMWAYHAFSSVPLRHHVACIVSCTALVTIALEITAFVDFFFRLRHISGRRKQCC